MHEYTVMRRKHKTFNCERCGVKKDARAFRNYGKDRLVCRKCLNPRKRKPARDFTSPPGVKMAKRFGEARGMTARCRVCDELITFTTRDGRHVALDLADREPHRHGEAA